ncbi:MAG TPA: hypothetical protein DCG51_11245 [Erysipelotrichaceae bacterium]|nr:hypothetical protein [Erysipelotrichaceae bacterium]
MNKNKEYRSFSEVKNEWNEYRVEGYASTFAPYEMCEIEGEKYFERIEPTAFDECDMSDVVLRVDHQGAVYARTSAGTVQLDTDEHGLHIMADLSRTANSRALYEEIKAGNYPQMSFAFTVADDGDHYDEESRTRVISNIKKLYDVSPVSFPANPGTELHARALEYFNGVIEELKAERPEEEIAEAQPEEQRKEQEEVVTAEAEAAEERAIEVKAEDTAEVSADADPEEERKTDAEEYRKIQEAVISGELGNIIESHEERKETNKMFEINTVEYRDAWVKNLIGRDMSAEERSALTSAGAVIPTMTVNAVWDKLIKPAELLGKVDVTQFPNYVRFPKATTNNAATSQAVGGTISESSDVIGYVDLVPAEYVKLLTVGADIDHMAIPAVHDWIVDNLTGQIRAKMNADVLVGSNSNAFKGITASVNANATAIPSTLTRATLLKIMGTLDANYQNGAIWIMTPSMFYSEVMALETLNDYIINEGFQFKLFGHDVVLMSEALVSSKETIFYGDPKAYKVNIFKPLEVKRFETATTTNLQFRGACLADGELLDTSAFVRFART